MRRLYWLTRPTPSTGRIWASLISGVNDESPDFDRSQEGWHLTETARPPPSSDR